MLKMKKYVGHELDTALDRRSWLINYSNSCINDTIYSSAEEGLLNDSIGEVTQNVLNDFYRKITEPEFNYARYYGLDEEDFED
jgi:hypothetical protein